MNLPEYCNAFLVSEGVIAYKKHSRVEKGKTDEYSKIPESGTTDSKVFSIRDVYAGSDMHHRVIEQERGTYHRPIISLRVSKINVHGPELLCCTPLFSCFQMQEDSGEWSLPLSAGFMLF